MVPMSTRAAGWEAAEARSRTVPRSRRDAAKLAALAEVACSNVLIASLPRDLREELVAHATFLELKHGDAVERQGGAKRVFFPLSGMLTGVRTREDGSHYAYLHRGREAAVNAIGPQTISVSVIDWIQSVESDPPADSSSSPGDNSNRTRRECSNSRTSSVI